MTILPAVLALADGSIFRGQSIGAPSNTTGEVVFNTALTGYQEILTDPSYARQIVTLTYPHIGNTGVNAEDVESTAVHAAGLIVRPNPGPNFSPANYATKARRWKALWPEVTVLPVETSTALRRT